MSNEKSYQSIQFLGDTYHIDCQEQPVNYSLKYPEESSSGATVLSPHKNFRKTTVSDIKKSNQNATMYTSIPQNNFMYPYAESDMDTFDQPTDYSRKYHEYSPDECNQQITFTSTNHRYSKVTPGLSGNFEDTIRVFCTEDTPPNFSSVSSFTDLREIGLPGFQSPNNCEETLSKTAETLSLKDLSLSDKKSEEIPDENKESSSSLNAEVPDEQASKVDDEISVNQTPLMFSRSSSLSSLNSFEQHSVRDDRSSVSDFGYEDTVKVFCTEDTPLNFSSASSLTDLRAIGLSGLQTPNSCFEENLEKNIAIITSLKENSVTDQKETKILHSENHSETSIQSPNEQTHKIDDESCIDQTPLMFSRSSSLCSLNSFEQPSIHDDQSFVSDFSCMTSGAISPSDLPDSPPCFSSKVSEVENKSCSQVFALDNLNHSDTSNSCLNDKSIKSPSSCKFQNETGDVSSSHGVEKMPRNSISAISITENTKSNENGATPKSKISDAERAIINKYIQLGLPKSSPKVLYAESTNPEPGHSLSKNVNPKLLLNVTQNSEKNDTSNADFSSKAENVEATKDEKSSRDRAIIDTLIQLGLPSSSPKSVLPNLMKNKASVDNVSKGLSSQMQKRVSPDFQQKTSPKPEAKNIKSPPKTPLKKTNAPKSTITTDTDEKLNRAIIDTFIQLGLPRSSSKTISSTVSKIPNAINQKCIGDKVVPNTCVQSHKSLKVSSVPSSSKLTINVQNQNMSAIEEKSNRAIIDSFIQLGLPESSSKAVFFV